MRGPGANRATCVVEVGVSLPRRISGQAILVMSGRAARCTNTFSPSRREQSSGRGQSLEGPTALLTTLGPVSQTGRNRSYKGPRGYPPESRGHADRTSMDSACFPRSSLPTDASLSGGALARAR